MWEAFWRLATADVPTEILGTSLAARIVPATKPNGGVRPFAIGQVIRRVVCKATAKLLTKKVRSIASPHQFAVGMKHPGTSAADAHMFSVALRCILALFPLEVKTDTWFTVCSLVPQGVLVLLLELVKEARSFGVMC